MQQLLAQQRLGTYVRHLMASSLSQTVRERAVVALLDAVGLALRAREEPTTRALRASLEGNIGERGGASLWGTTSRASAEIAAIVNGTAVHAHFQDDTDMDAWVHPGSLVVPASVALAEDRGLTVGSLVTSIVAGYTTLHWLGRRGAVGRAVVKRGFRASAVLGPIGAAAAAGAALQLSEHEIENAVGLAADLAGGTVEPVRSGFQSWRIQNGSAGFLGILAARLAAAGVATSPESIERGWLRAHAGAETAPHWADPPAAEDMLSVWQKHFPTLGDNIAASVTAAALSTDVDPRAVTKIVVRIASDFAEYPGTSFRGPFVRVEQALASTAYAVSSALVHGHLDYHRQQEDLDDELINGLVSRIEVVGDPSFGHLDAEVTVVLGDRVLSAHSRDRPRTLFFRDRASAQQLFERICAEEGIRGGGAFCSALLTWLDGGSELPVPELMAGLR